MILRVAASVVCLVTGLAGETVAVMPKLLLHEVLRNMPEFRRSNLVLEANPEAALNRLANDQVTAVAGNELSMKFTAGRIRLEHLQTAPVKSVAYHLATQEGRAAEFGFLESALARMRQTGEFKRLVETHLAPARPHNWRDYAFYLGSVLVPVGLILLAVIAWNRSLRRRIGIHMAEIAQSLEEKKSEIRQRERTEARLREANARFESLLNTLDGVVWEADPQTTNFTFVSARAEQLLGYPLGDWYEDTFWIRRIHPDDRDEAVSSWTAATARQENHTFEYRMIAADGTIVWVQDFVTVVLEQGAVKNLRGILLDMTELKRAEEALQDTERLTRMVIDSAPDAVVQMDANGIVVDWNTQSEALFGWTGRLLKSGLNRAIRSRRT